MSKCQMGIDTILTGLPLATSRQKDRRWVINGQITDRRRIVDRRMSKSVEGQMVGGL